MTGPEFSALLAECGVTRRQVGQLVRRLAGVPGPDPHAIGRYCTGKRAVPPVLVALLRLYRRCPRPLRETLLPPESH